MEQSLFTIDEFCTVHRISRSLIYSLWKQGTGPRFFKLGSKVMITREAAAEWRAEREKATMSERAADRQVA
jgi:predicted DNA-binding transcriptional regulator AlpA